MREQSVCKGGGRAGGQGESSGKNKQLCDPLSFWLLSHHGGTQSLTLEFTGVSTRSSLADLSIYLPNYSPSCCAAHSPTHLQTLKTTTYRIPSHLWTHYHVAVPALEPTVPCCFTQKPTHWLILRSLLPCTFTYPLTNLLSPIPGLEQVRVQPITSIGSMPRLPTHKHSINYTTINTRPHH